MQEDTTIRDMYQFLFDSVLVRCQDSFYIYSKNDYCFLKTTGEQDGTKNKICCETYT